MVREKRWDKDFVLSVYSNIVDERKIKDRQICRQLNCKYIFTWKY